MVFDSVFIDVAIGIVFIYLLLSLVCTSISEIISQMGAIRSKNLEKSIHNLLRDPEAAGLASKFYNHPLITGLSRKGKSIWKARPSYIPSRIFFITLLDIIKENSEEKSNIISTDLRNAVETCTILNSENKKALHALINDANNKLDKSQKNIENWFDDAMERVSGEYKRKMQYIVVSLAILMVLTLNIDTFTIANNLAQDSTLRDSVIKSAQIITNQSEPNPCNASLNVTLYAIDELTMLPLGWSKEPHGPFDFNEYGYLNWFFRKLGGLLVTVSAISLGAPFWFDSLSKLVNIRGTGKKK
jgi:tetrahydromethanopterin S-methyltransferase subunit B